MNWSKIAQVAVMGAALIFAAWFVWGSFITLNEDDVCFHYPNPGLSWCLPPDLAI